MALMDDFDDDLANSFYSPDDFGASVLYTPTGGPSVTATGLLTPKYEAHLDVVNYVLEFEGPTSVFANAVPGETLVINGTTYHIDGPPQQQPGGTTILYLNEETQ